MNIAFAKTISLGRIDPDDLEEVEDIPEAVRFSIVLSEEPSEIWVHEFNLAYGLIHHQIKPPIAVEGDRLWIGYLPRYAAELPGYLAFLKVVVERANLEEELTLGMQRHDTAGQKAQFREILRKVRLP